MCLPFEVFFCLFVCLFVFREIWYNDGGVSTEMKEPKFKTFVSFDQIIVKNTQFGQSCVLFYRKRYGQVIRQKLV